MGQAYAVFLFTRYKLKKSSATLQHTVAQCAKPTELLGDIHGYIAVRSPPTLRASGGQPDREGGHGLSIVRDLYLVDKSSPATDLPELPGEGLRRQGPPARGRLRLHYSMSFGHLWYAHLRLEDDG